MLKVKDLAVELSIKVGDARTDNGDGILFLREDRLRYIERAYGKLMRTLSMGMRKYKPNFVLPLTPMFVNPLDMLDKPSPYKLNVPVIAVEEVIVARGVGNALHRLLASKLAPQNYNQVAFGLDEVNKATENNIFYVLINGVIYLLPNDEKYTGLFAMGVRDLQTLTYDDGEGNDTEIPIDKVYSDLLITLAAIEAMNDLPNPQKVGLYRQELIDHVSIIANYANLMERREGDTGNG